MPDSNLTVESYQQIIAKIYASIRYKAYQTVKKIAKERGLEKDDEIELEEETMGDVLREIDVEPIRRATFDLYGVKEGLDSQLQLKKIQYMNSDDEMFQNYLDCLKKAHDKFLLFIFKGHKFQKLEQHPLHSTDLSYGIPPLFNQILDELLEEADDDYEAYSTPQDVGARMTITKPMGRKTEQYKKLGEMIQEDYLGEGRDEDDKMSAHSF